MKRCSRCEIILPLDRFYRNASSPDGRHSRCKECHQAKKYDACPICGARKWNRAERCQTCASPLAGKDHPNWKGDEVSTKAARNRARAVIPTLGVCEHPDCTAPAADRHHIDGDTLNNTRANLAGLCRRHHMEADGRLAALAAQASDAGRRGGNPHGRRNAPRGPDGKFLFDQEAVKAA